MRFGKKFYICKTSSSCFLILCKKNPWNEMFSQQMTQPLKHMAQCLWLTYSRSVNQKDHAPWQCNSNMQILHILEVFRHAYSNDIEAKSDFVQFFMQHLQVGQKIEKDGFFISQVCEGEFLQNGWWRSACHWLELFVADQSFLKEGRRCISEKKF